MLQVCTAQNSISHSYAFLVPTNKSANMKYTDLILILQCHIKLHTVW